MKIKTTTLWLISYIMVLMLPIIINFVTYSTVEDVILTQTEKYNGQNLDNKLKDIDRLTESMISTATYFAQEKKITEFGEYTYPFTNVQRYNMIEYMRTLPEIVRAADLTNLYVYFPKSDYVFGVNGSGGSRTDYFRFIYDGDEQKFEEWTNILRERKNGAFHVFRDNKCATLIYSYVLTNSLMGDSAPCVVAEIKRTEIEQLLKDEAGGSFCVYDDEGKLIIENKDPELQKIIDEAMHSGKKSQSVSYNGRRLIITGKRSAKSQWRCSYLIDRSEYMENITIARIISYLGMVLSIFIGILLIRFSVRRNHKPIAELVEQLSKASHRVRDGVDDYKYISKIVSSTIMENSKYADVVSMQKKVLRESVLNKLLNSYDQRNDMPQLLRSFDIKLPNQYFLTVAILLEDVSGLFFEKSGSYEDNMKQAQFIVTNVLEELLQKYFDAYVFRRDNIICCIVNSRGCDVATERILTDCITEANEFTQKNFNFRFVSAVSEWVCGMDNISTAHEQAMEILEYKFVISDEVILRPNDVKRGVDNNYHYPMQKEQQIITAVKAGDYDAALEFLDEILDKNFGEGYLSVQLSKCLIFDILCTIIKALKEINNPNSVEYLKSGNLYERITGCQTVHKMRDELTEIMREVCGDINSGSKKHSFTMERVTDYIERFYDDTNLSVAVIAQECGMTPNYLSMVFKQSTGRGLLEYIQEIRIEKAKELLKSTGENQETIARLVGYSNSRTFARVFRKYVGITPGSYRQRIEQINIEEKNNHE